MSIKCIYTFIKICPRIKVLEVRPVIIKIPLKDQRIRAVVSVK
jgi:hypothetical protein